MSRKNQLAAKILTAQSLSAAFTSPPTLIKYLDNCSYQINISTSNSTGTFSVQGSNDFAMNEPSNTVTNPGNWAAIPLSAVISAAAANDTALIDLNQLPFTAVRVSYAPTIAGTGVIDLYLQMKQVGG